MSSRVRFPLDFLQIISLGLTLIPLQPNDQNSDDENVQYKQKYEDLKVLYEQLLLESQQYASHDSSDVVRQQKLMRAKNIQLEHQVQRLTDAADLRADLLGEVENAAFEIQDMLAGENPTADIKWLQKWSAAVIMKLRTYKSITKEASNQVYYMDSFLLNRTCSVSMQDLAQGMLLYIYIACLYTYIVT